MLCFAARAWNVVLTHAIAIGGRRAERITASQLAEFCGLRG